MCETGECFLRLGLGKRWDFSFLLGIQMDNSISGKLQRLASFWGLETRKAGVSLPALCTAGRVTLHGRGSCAV